MLNLHQLADEMNRDRLARAEYRRPARQLRSRSPNQAVRQALQAVRQAIEQIDAIIEGASNRLPRTHEHPDSHPTDTAATPAEPLT
jgi:hypothetical protein